ncbi:KR domain-containing protein (plasmid) [Bacillus thuringiensis]|nr:beta-ketoacyl synthase N-terminal-like domain-containing protein [Bacillus thuringiensis]QFQ28650.1 KR domain-containing protein [Bacillus thuringiensis]
MKKLVLTGREQLPSREHWDEYEHLDSGTGRKVSHIRELEALGAQVQVLSLTLSDEQAVREGIETVVKTMGPVGGVIHSAGLGDRDIPAFIRKQPEGIRRVLEPKVQGVDILCQVLQEQPLRFFVLFSSVSSIIPSLASGQSDYAMANSYMDYAATAHAEGYPMVSVQWPSWKETGFGEVKSQIYHQTGLLSHTNEEGLAMLDMVLTYDVDSVVLPAMVDPEVWQPKRLMSRRLEEQQKSAPVQLQPAQKDSGTLLDKVIERLVGLFSSELKIDPKELELDVSFQEFGVDSIILVQMLRTINQWVGEELDPSILYEYASIESLAGWLVQTYPSALRGEADSGTTVQQVVDSRGMPLESYSQELPPSPKLQVRSEQRNGDIAVIGMSCKLPGAPSLDTYWDLLKEGRSAIDRVPKERWGQEADYYAGLVEIPTEQVASRFHIAAEDARVMDPQALLLLEESLRAWHHAGYTVDEIKGAPVGVYIGGRSQHRPDDQELQAARNPILAVGPNYLAANISHYFDLRGPSLVLDTACSSALVGLHMAVQALRSGEINGALVGGVSLLGTDQAHRLFDQRGILSGEPNFHLFDERASGAVLSEGGGVVIVKTLERAKEDGDRIYAVIKGTAVNNDGRTAGPATPNIQAQLDVMRTALERSGKQATDISYIEANGSGSLVTDLLELKAIRKIYREERSEELGVGSSKPNIGHPLCAEGIAGLIKVVLMLHHRELVPFLSGHQPMKHFNIAASPFHFTRENTIWEGERPIAGINCFADGGTNAHVIVEAWEPGVSGDVTRGPIEQEKQEVVQRLDSETNKKGIHTRRNWWVQEKEAVPVGNGNANTTGR